MELNREELKKALENLRLDRATLVRHMEENQSKQERHYTEAEIEEVDEQIDDIMMLLERASGWGRGNKFVGRRY